jgi:DNA-binding IclR family transcriptional regulator
MTKVLVKRGEPVVPSEDKGDQFVVKSAARVLHLLELFMEARKPMRLGDISRAMEMPSSSSSVLVRSLVQLGYLTFDADHRTYFPTYKVVFLGSWMEQESSDSRVSELMNELSRLTSETIILGAEMGRHVQYIGVIQGTLAIRYHTKPGTKRLLPSANLGIALLSRKSNEEIGRIVRSINADLSEGSSKFELARVMALVKRYRSNGYICEPNMLVKGAAVVATLLPTEPALAIGIGGVVDRVRPNEERIAAVIRETREIFFEGVGLRR